MIRTHTLLRLTVAHAESLLIVVLSAMYTLAPLWYTSAADILNRKVTIGTSRPSTVTTHTFNFDIISGTDIGSIVFEYCDNSPLIGAPCNIPPGLDMSGATLLNQTGETGFSVHPSTNAFRLILTRTPTTPTPQPVSYEIGNVVNPSAQQASIFVRISTYATDDASGPRIDQGAVVFATTRSLTTTGFVPPFLTFCTGITVALDCSTTDGDFINFGELLRTLPSTATSQFSGATNDPAGYNVAVYGNTMTSGTNIIPALSSNGGSSVGTSQYGLNLRQNTAPVIGTNPAGTGTAVVSPNYDTPNSFRFVTSETLTSSDLPTEFNRFTVSYLVNVSTAQSPGVYATTMTYIATASF